MYPQMLCYARNIWTILQDLIIVFSAKGRSRMVMDLVELAKETKTSILCITNDINSPAAKSSDPCRRMESITHKGYYIICVSLLDASVSPCR